MLTVAVANHKSGTGKTTTLLGLASSAASMGARTLVIDLDPQAHATRALGVGVQVGEPTPEWTTTEVLRAACEGAAAGAISSTRWKGVDLIPADLHLAERDTDAALGTEYALREACRGLDGYDLVLLDCPPSVGRLTTNALVASTHVLLVTDPSTLGLQGARRIAETIETLKRFHRRQVRLAGALVNIATTEVAEAPMDLGELKVALPSDTWAPTIQRSAILAQSLALGRPIHSFGTAALDVSRAFDEHLSRLMWLDPVYRQAHPTMDPDRWKPDAVAAALGIATEP